MADQKFYGLIDDHIVAITAPAESDTDNLAYQEDCNYVTDEDGAKSIRNGLDALLGDRPEMDNPHSHVDYIFNQFDRNSLADALAQHGFVPAK